MSNARSSRASSSAGEAEDMDAYHQELMEFLRESTSMRSMVKNSMKQGLWAGGGAVAGGMLLGPVGGLVGGVTGSLVGFWQSDDYDGVLNQLVQLPAARQSRLVRAVAKILTDASSSSDNDFFESPEAFKASLVEFCQRRDVREHVWRVCNEVLNGDDSAAETILTE